MSDEADPRRQGLVAGVVGLVALALVVGGIFWLRARSAAEEEARRPIDLADGNARMCETLVAHANMAEAREWVTKHETRVFRPAPDRPISHEASLGIVQSLLEVGAEEVWIQVYPSESYGPLQASSPGGETHWTDTLVVAVPADPEARRAIFAIQAASFEVTVLDVGQKKLLFDFKNGGYRGPP